jgi:hypothetical protein
MPSAPRIQEGPANTPDHPVRQALSELADLCALLPEALTSGPGGGPRTHAGPSASVPLRLDVLQLLDLRDRSGWLDGMEYCDPEGVGVLPYLWGWARDFEATALDECPTAIPALPEKPTLSSVTNWLISQLDWITGTAQWPDFEWGVLHVHRAVRAAVKHLREAGPAVPCSRCGAGHLEVLPGRKAAWRCTACGHEVTIQAVTLRQAASLVGVPLRTLYRWDARRMITAVCDEQGRRWWDLGDIRRAAAQTRLTQLGLALD